MSSIRTNKVNFTADYEAIQRRYDFFTVRRTDGKYITWSAAALDASIDEKNITAILHAQYRDGDGRCIYVMMDKAGGSGYKRISTEENRARLEAAVNKQGKGKSSESEYDVQPLHFSENDSEIMKRNFILLLIYGVKNAGSGSRHACNNLMGTMYCCTPKGRVGKKQIKTIKVNVNKDMCLELGGAVFSKSKLSSLMNLGKHTITEFPKFTVSEEGLPTIMRYIPKGEDDKTETYIQHQLKNKKKAVIPFLNFTDGDWFAYSKMGCLSNILSLFKSKYGRMASIEFDTIPEDDISSPVVKKDSPAKQRKRRKELVDRNGGIINICNYVHDDDRSEQLQASLIQALDEYGIKYILSDAASKDMMNISIIHDEEYYTLPENADKDDPHIDSPEYIIQHVTVENFGSDDHLADCIINKLIDEMIIKQDIKNEQLTIYDWVKLNHETDWTFVVIDTFKVEKKAEEGQPAQADSSSDENIEKTVFYTMTINPKGHFTLSRSEEEPECLKNFTDRLYMKDMKDIQCIIIRGEKEINYIVDTKLFTIPEIEKIQKRLDNGEPVTRDKKTLDELMGGIFNIKYYRQDGRLFYYAGTIGSGIKCKVQRSAKIREVRAARNSPLFFDEIVPLLNVDFIRENQVTVVPFPVKFIRAFKELQEGVRSSDDQ